MRKDKLLRLNFVLFGMFTVASLTQAHSHDDPYSPLITFLKDLRKARKHSRLSTGNGGGIRDGGNNGQSQENIGSSVSNSDTSSIRVGVSDGGSSSNSNSNYNNNNNNNFNNNNDNNRAPLTNAQLEQVLAQAAAQLPTSPPYDITRVNTGVSTILNGVGSGSLAEILRGSFTFTRNNNVQSVANTVIDSIFGTRDGRGGWASNLGSGSNSASNSNDNLGK
jgi:hypothetical protein